MLLMWYAEECGRGMLSLLLMYSSFDDSQFTTTPYWRQMKKKQSKYQNFLFVFSLTNWLSLVAVLMLSIRHRNDNVAFCSSFNADINKYT